MSRSSPPGSVNRAPAGSRMPKLWRARTVQDQHRDFSTTNYRATHCRAGEFKREVARTTAEIGGAKCATARGGAPPRLRKAARQGVSLACSICARLEAAENSYAIKQ